jgi:hypothetical protein
VLPYQNEHERIDSEWKHTLAISMMPPHIKQKAHIISEGGLAGYPEMEGEKCRKR